jgi:hypothetical protein
LKNNQFNLGDRVRVKARAVPKKVDSYRTGLGDRQEWYLMRQWVREEVQAEGIIAGVRTVKEGKSEPWPDAGWIFEPTRSLKTYLVAVNMRDMWHVLPEDLELSEVSEHI